MGQEEASQVRAREVGMPDSLPRTPKTADDIRLLRAALRNIHDVVGLDGHPWAGGRRAGGAGGGRQLRQLLLEAVAATQPATNSPDRKGTLRHELLVRRYLEGREIAD